MILIPSFRVRTDICDNMIGSTYVSSIRHSSEVCLGRWSGLSQEQYVGDISRELVHMAR